MQSLLLREMEILLLVRCTFFAVAACKLHIDNKYKEWSSYYHLLLTISKVFL